MLSIVSALVTIVFFRHARFCSFVVAALVTIVVFFRHAPFCSFVIAALVTIVFFRSGVAALVAIVFIRSGPYCSFVVAVLLVSVFFRNGAFCSVVNRPEALPLGCTSQQISERTITGYSRESVFESEITAGGA